MQFLFFNAIGVTLTKKMINEQWMQEIPERNESSVSVYFAKSQSLWWSNREARSSTKLSSEKERWNNCQLACQDNHTQGNATRASYELAQHGNQFAEGDLIKEHLTKVVAVICPLK